jgi:hypothetical protein
MIDTFFVMHPDIETHNDLIHTLERIGIITVDEWSNALKPHEFVPFVPPQMGEAYEDD